MYKLLFLLIFSAANVTAPPNKLSIASSVTLRRGKDAIYHYNFTDGEIIDLNCSLTDAADFEKKYDIAFYNQNISVASSKERFQKSTTHVWHRFTLNKESKSISCAAFEGKVVKSRIVVRLNYNPQPTQVSAVKLTIEGLTNNSCVEKGKFTQTCNYTYDQDRIEIPVTLRCVFGGTTQEDSDFTVKFGTNSKKVAFKKDVFSEKIVSYVIPLNSKNNTVTCNATKTSIAKVWTINVNIHYIPKSTTSTTTTTTEPATAQRIQSIEPPQVNSTLPVTQSSGEEESSSTYSGWLKWLLGGVVLFITICVVVGCLVVYCQKKPPPADSTYANLTKDQSKPTPMPAPRTIQKTNDGQKPNAARKPNVALENNYNEPKDSQDMSEALYADPNRFVGDSSNYAEPYVAKPTPPCDTYAEPYKTNYAEPNSCISEGNYAELNLPDCSGKELYARPIPKAQRKPKQKDDCDYSNVFGGQYGNTKK